MADLVDNYIVAPRVALANGDREMISMLKIVYKKSTSTNTNVERERGSSTFEGLHPFGFVCTCSSQTFVTVLVSIA